MGRTQYWSLLWIFLGHPAFPIFECFLNENSIYFNSYFVCSTNPFLIVLSQKIRLSTQIWYMAISMGLRLFRSLYLFHFIMAKIKINVSGCHFFRPEIKIKMTKMKIKMTKKWHDILINTEVHKMIKKIKLGWFTH